MYGSSQLRLVEHCSANAEATGSNPVEAPKSYSFHLYSRSSHHFILYYVYCQCEKSYYISTCTFFKSAVLRYVFAQDLHRACLYHLLVEVSFS